MISIKARPSIFFLMNGLMFMTSCNCVQAQNSSSDKQAVAMLKELYTAYITEWSKMTTPFNETKLNSIKKKYCITSLVSKITNQLESGQLDADPFLQAQDVDIS